MRERRIDCALRICDAAVERLQAQGRSVRGMGVTLVVPGGTTGVPSIDMNLRTPFQRFLLGTDPKRIRGWAVDGGMLPRKKNLSYCLDIWVAGKVLNIEWNEHGKVELLSFRRGKWEDIVLGWSR